MVLSRVGLGLGLFVAPGTTIAVLSKIWAASVAAFSQDLSVPDPMLRCGVEWVGVGVLWERDPGVLLWHRWSEL